MVRPRCLLDAERIDRAVYAAIASTETPALDRGMSRLSRAADHSRLSFAAAAGLAVRGALAQLTTRTLESGPAQATGTVGSANR
jgi:hypothetical protein